MFTAANEQAAAIAQVFADAGLGDYSRLPDDPASRKKFPSAFAELTRRIESALIQGFEWGMSSLIDDTGNAIDIDVTKDQYDAWTQRYAELADEVEQGEATDGIPLDLEALAMARTAQVIDAEYLDERFASGERQLHSHKPPRKSATTSWSSYVANTPNSPLTTRRLRIRLSGTC